ncbi:phospholipase A2 inhibitor and Ly6/PLAUR domain-containing protein-like [Anomaloglossus baeobatrachus]|uniref:phospholipase A2 inhibitor and Ly6/PLAUR domain-containing protein-like n=1 Tax=Anomaloglossus baeobatrachus TaxID=238106 RepID=UPI003F50A034
MTSALVSSDGKLLIEMYKNCANETLCGTKGALVVGYTFRFYASCCDGEFCNNKGYELPPENQTQNGVICPSDVCFNTLKECKTEKMRNCTESMNRCFDYRGSIINPDRTFTKYSAKGCVNDDACRNNVDSKIAFEETRRVYVKC